MVRHHIKRGDTVVVISGAEKGKRGKVISILSKNNRVIVEGLQMVKKHIRKNQANPEGAIIEREGSIHISNVMKADRYEARRATKGLAQTTEA